MLISICLMIFSIRWMLTPNLIYLRYDMPRTYHSCDKV
ncbi:hypothetical protein ES332_D11G331200v1 [Gossypium tomentosum]|uniref:Uncharacterized protein n=1 Tax=Gossypium tomentosum TaxID=34277 RepID=A0A5D2IWU1_GOSTO|nr:hypothetical protein ES332_D11G331200v1 [Gossypium tomentosum]